MPEYAFPNAIANLGDVNYLVYGGRLVLAPTEDNPDPSVEVIDPPPEDEVAIGWHIYRFDLEPLKVVEQDNTMYLVPAAWDESWPHPLASYDEWFHKDLAAVASSTGMDVQKLREGFCSDNLVARAVSWCALGDYHGFNELDHYPLHLSEHEAHERYGLVEDCQCPECDPPEEDDDE
jgi:hypothetical protein